MFHYYLVILIRRNNGRASSQSQKSHDVYPASGTWLLSTIFLSIRRFANKSEGCMQRCSPRRPRCCETTASATRSSRSVIMFLHIRQMVEEYSRAYEVSMSCNTITAACATHLRALSYEANRKKLGAPAQQNSFCVRMYPTSGLEGTFTRQVGSDAQDVQLQFFDSSVSQRTHNRR